MKKRILIIISIFSTFLIMGCYPDGPDYVEELDIVLTNHNPEYDFTGNQTYAMPDQIVKITGNLAEGEDPEFIPDITAQKILATIEDNMTALGYDRVEVSADPDLILAPASWETTTVVYWYDWWYWWYGGYYPGWGWGGGYYPPVYYDSFTTGTLVMTLMDKDVVGANGNPIIQWTGAINGLLTGSYDAARVDKAINKAFDQSPYLKTN